MAKKLRAKQKKEEQKGEEKKEESKEERKEDRRPKFDVDEYIKKAETGQRIVVDCMFDDKMIDREIKSMVQQLGYVYSSNKKSANPANVRITGIGPRMKKQLEKVHYDKWRIKFTEDDYISQYPKEDLVYLTADAKETMTTIDPKCVYIIGGIVDRNRYKMITYDKAVKQGIRTAKLPIAEHINLKATKVLTVNHVFDILLKYMETKDWASTFLSILPLRKEAEAKAVGSDPTAGEPDKKKKPVAEVIIVSELAREQQAPADKKA